MVRHGIILGFSRFNPRAREGRDVLVQDIQRAWGLKFQSTRPRGARPAILDIARPAARVSIHAPARGATRDHHRPRRHRRVSIHAPARGATGCEIRMPAPRRGFNPRAREGRDLFRAGVQLLRGAVSIHAPARGATVVASPTVPEMAVFQSTRPRGARLGGAVVGQLVARFQSTRPRGARQGPDPPGDQHPAVSIHAPARGATRNEGPYRGHPRGFNPRAREGRDAKASEVALGKSLFQSTRPRGARPGIAAGRAGLTRRRFNPRAREGRDSPDRAFGG